MGTVIWEVNLQGYAIIIQVFSQPQSALHMGKYHNPTSGNNEIKLSQEDSTQLKKNSTYQF